MDYKVAWEKLKEQMEIDKKDLSRLVGEFKDKLPTIASNYCARIDALNIVKYYMERMEEEIK